MAAASRGATEVALTKLDVLSGMKEVPLCVQYELNGALTDDFPSRHPAGGKARLPHHAGLELRHFRRAPL